MGTPLPRACYFMSVVFLIVAMCASRFLFWFFCFFFLVYCYFFVQSLLSQDTLIILRLYVFLMMTLKRLESIYEALRLLEQGSVLRNMQDTMR